jgi:hypothetical protein
LLKEFGASLGMIFAARRLVDEAES